MESRREAGPVSSLTELSRDQRECATRVATLVASIARSEQGWGKSPASPPGPRQELLVKLLPQIDPVRASQTLLIDGARGSGKTTVLVSLLRHWGARLQGTEGTLNFPDDGCTIVPVPIIDLNPVPIGTNLAMLLLARIHTVDEALSGETSIPGSGPWLSDLVAPESVALVQPWQDLVSAVAGWFGGAELRRLNVPAEEFAIELGEQTLRGLRVNERFREYANQLLQRLHEELKGSSKPLLVVPIDDADMSPHRAAELLELLRMFSHPRIVFLLTGDSTLFVTELAAYYLGALWNPLKSLPTAPQVIDSRNDTMRLASEVYGRVVPPDQRFGIRRSVVNLLEFNLSSFAGELQGRSLAGALELFPLLYPLRDVPAERGKASTDDSERIVGPDRNLRDLFKVRLYRGELESTGTSDGPRGSEVTDLFRLRAALPDRLRELVDFIRHVDRMAPLENDPREPESKTERLLRYMWRQAVIDEGHTQKLQQSLERVFKTEDESFAPAGASMLGDSPSDERRTGQRRILLVDGEKLSMEFSYRELYRFQTTPLGMSVALRSRVRTRIRFRPEDSAPSNGRGADASEADGAIWLSTRSAATLKLATDVVATRATPLLSQDAIPGETGFIGRSLLASKEFEGAFVRVNYYSESTDRNLRFVWRVPRWDSFLDLDLFQQLWEYFAPLAGKIEQLARIFAILAIAVSRREDVDAVVRSAGNGPSTLSGLLKLRAEDRDTEFSWRLIQRAAFNDDPKWWNTRRAGAFATWREAVLPAFAAPESGLESADANVVLNALLSDLHTTAIRRVFEKTQFERRRHLQAVIAAAFGRERGGVDGNHLANLEKELRSINADGERFALTDQLAELPPPKRPKSVPPDETGSRGVREGS